MLLSRGKCPKTLGLALFQSFELFRQKARQIVERQKQKPPGCSGTDNITINKEGSAGKDANFDVHLYFHDYKTGRQ